MKGSHDEPGLKAETSNDKAEEIHRASRRGGLENYSCPEEVSYNETGLLEETYQARIHEWCSGTIHNTDHQDASSLDSTTSQLGRKEPDRESILKEDIDNDEDETITLEEGDDEYEKTRSVKSSSNQREDSYYERKNDGSK